MEAEILSASLTISFMPTFLLSAYWKRREGVENKKEEEKYDYKDSPGPKAMFLITC